MNICCLVQDNFFNHMRKGQFSDQKLCQHLIFSYFIHPWTPSHRLTCWETFAWISLIDLFFLCLATFGMIFCPYYRYQHHQQFKALWYHSYMSYQYIKYLAKLSHGQKAQDVLSSDHNTKLPGIME